MKTQKQAQSTKYALYNGSGSIGTSENATNKRKTQANGSSAAVGSKDSKSSNPTSSASSTTTHAAKNSASTTTNYVGKRKPPGPGMVVTTATGATYTYQSGTGVGGGSSSSNAHTTNSNSNSTTASSHHHQAASSASSTSQSTVERLEVTVIPVDEHPYAKNLQIPQSLLARTSGASQNNSSLASSATQSAGQQYPSLKDIFQSSDTLWKPIFGNFVGANKKPQFAIFRKPIERRSEIPGVKDSTELSLHILYLKRDSIQFPRNAHANQIEVYCSKFFYGPLVVVFCDTKPPYRLHNFPPEYLIDEIEPLNELEQKFYPLPFGTKRCSLVRSLENEERFTLNLEKFEQVLSPQEFMLYCYKTSFCPVSNSIIHDWSKCNYAHRQQDFRRPPYLFFYYPERCPRIADDGSWESCEYELYCDYAHTLVEILYNPLNFKKNICGDQIPSDKYKCPKHGKRCCHAHSPEEIAQIANLIESPVPKALPQEKDVMRDYIELLPEYTVYNNGGNSQTTGSENNRAALGSPRTTTTTTTTSSTSTSAAKDSSKPFAGMLKQQQQLLHQQQEESKKASQQGGSKGTQNPTASSMGGGSGKSNAPNNSASSQSTSSSVIGQNKSASAKTTSNISNLPPKKTGLMPIPGSAAPVNRSAPGHTSSLQKSAQNLTSNNGHIDSSSTTVVTNNQFATNSSHNSSVNLSSAAGEARIQQKDFPEFKDSTPPLHNSAQYQQNNPLNSSVSTKESQNNLPPNSPPNRIKTLETSEADSLKSSGANASTVNVSQSVNDPSKKVKRQRGKGNKGVMVVVSNQDKSDDNSSDFDRNSTQNDNRNAAQSTQASKNAHPTSSPIPLNSQAQPLKSKGVQKGTLEGKRQVNTQVRGKDDYIPGSQSVDLKAVKRKTKESGVIQDFVQPSSTLSSKQRQDSSAIKSSKESQKTPLQSQKSVASISKEKADRDLPETIKQSQKADLELVKMALIEHQEAQLGKIQTNTKDKKVPKKLEKAQSKVISKVCPVVKRSQESYLQKQVRTPQSQTVSKLVPLLSSCSNSEDEDGYVEEWKIAEPITATSSFSANNNGTKSSKGATNTATPIDNNKTSSQVKDGIGSKAPIQSQQAPSSKNNKINAAEVSGRQANYQTKPLSPFGLMARNTSSNGISSAPQNQRIEMQHKVQQQSTTNNQFVNVQPLFQDQPQSQFVRKQVHQPQMPFGQTHQTSLTQAHLLAGPVIIPQNMPKMPMPDKVLQPVQPKIVAQQSPKVAVPKKQLQEIIQLNFGNSSQIYNQLYSELKVSQKSVDQFELNSIELVSDTLQSVGTDKIMAIPNSHGNFTSIQALKSKFNLLRNQNSSKNQQEQIAMNEGIQYLRVKKDNENMTNSYEQTSEKSSQSRGSSSTKKKRVRTRNRKNSKASSKRNDSPLPPDMLNNHQIRDNDSHILPNATNMTDTITKTTTSASPEHNQQNDRPLLGVAAQQTSAQIHNRLLGSGRRMSRNISAAAADSERGNQCSELQKSLKMGVPFGDFSLPTSLRGAPSWLHTFSWVLFSDPIIVWETTEEDDHLFDATILFSSSAIPTHTYTHNNDNTFWLLGNQQQPPLLTSDTTQNDENLTTKTICSRTEIPQQLEDTNSIFHQTKEIEIDSNVQTSNQSDALDSQDPSAAQTQTQTQTQALLSQNTFMQQEGFRLRFDEDVPDQISQIWIDNRFTLDFPNSSVTMMAAQQQPNNANFGLMLHQNASNLHIQPAIPQPIQSTTSNSINGISSSSAHQQLTAALQHQQQLQMYQQNTTQPFQTAISSTTSAQAAAAVASSRMSCLDTNAPGFYPVVGCTSPLPSTQTPPPQSTQPIIGQPSQP